MTSSSKPAYTPPALIDLGSTEGIGKCENGTGVRICSDGHSFNEGGDCITGTVATLSCQSGALQEDTCEGGLGAVKLDGESGAKDLL